MHANDMWLFAHNKGYPKRLVKGFVFVALIVSSVATLLLMERFRTYQADLDMLVVSKSSEGAIEAPAARDALILLGSKTDFLYNVNEVVDVHAITFSKTGETSFLIHAIADNPIDARDGAVETSQELFALVGKYYDIRTNIDVRSLGSPRTEASVTHPVLLLGAAIAFGLIGTAAFFTLILSIARVAFSVRAKDAVSTSESVFPTEEEPVKKEEAEAPYVFSPETFVPKKIENKFFSFEPSGVEREKDYAHFNRGPAPANLPIAAEDDADALPDFLFAVSEQIAPDASTDTTVEEAGMVDESVVETPAEPVTPKENESLPDIEPVLPDESAEILSSDREPSAQEYKRRLNELLSGKMPTEKR